MSQRGNILFLILLAVVLFAALSYAVTGSQRGSGKEGVADEKTDSIASEIINYTALLSNTVNRLKIGGCKDSELSFENSTFAGYTNSGTPADGRCKVFSPTGGGMNTKVWDATQLNESNVGKTFYGETLITASTCVYGQGTAIANDAATMSCWQQGDNSALVAFVPYLDYTTCLAINKKIFGIAGVPTECNGLGVNRYQGSFPVGPKSALDFCTADGFPNTLLRYGMASGCALMPGNANPSYLQNQYVFWQTIYAH